VESTGRKPELVGVIVNSVLLTVVEKESVSVEVLVTTKVFVWVVRIVDVVENTSVTAVFVVVTVT
jgi:hypothetical protein